jgi:DNA helicase HerA-like ATPase
MNIFDVAGENFFKPLTSQFKILYLDCLTIIYDSYRSELSYGIDREILVSKLSDYFERSNISDIEFIPYEGDTFDSNSTFYLDSRYGKINLLSSTIFELNGIYYEIVSGSEYWAYDYCRLGE